MYENILQILLEKPICKLNGDSMELRLQIYCLCLAASTLTKPTVVKFMHRIMLLY